MERLEPDLLRLSAGGAAAVHVVLGETATLIDAGAPGRGPGIERELRRLGVAPRRILLTHGDPDHVGGSDHLRKAFDAEVLAAAAERPMIDRSAWRSISRRRRMLMSAFFRRTPPPTVDRWIGDTEREIGGIAVVPLPGHTPGHVAYLWRRWLLAGDAFVSGTRFRESLGLFTMDRVAARASIEGLLALELRGVSSSHGRPAEDPRSRLEALTATWR